ncbi:B3 domain-containing protein [Cardamine amara subsp. amara]|uniref:B3 domain-containing protein n=1 Tax=Cardamine amara subsp. amara TaxID=228776 RepID=A0ABD1BAY0_CARAN
MYFLSFLQNCNVGLTESQGPQVFVSHFCSDDMVIPIAYYDHLPDLLPKTAILQGPGGCTWNVAIKVKQEEEEVCFGQGWPKFVEDNTLSDGDFLTFVYNGDRIFEVSIYRSDGCKETGEDSEEDDEKEDRVYSVNSEEDIDICSESEMAKCRDKGKSKVEVEEDSDDEEDSLYSQSSEESEETETDTDSGSEFKLAKTIPKRKNKGKKTEDSDGDSNSEYIEAFGDLDIEENSNKERATCVKSKVKNPKKIEAAKKRKKVPPKIKNPERYLDNPENIHFETNVKNRLYELLVHAQLVKDYCLRFGDYTQYIDPHGTVKAKTAKWGDKRVCIKRWKFICKRNKLKIEDRVLCELLRKRDFVYAIKLHIVRAKDL